ncbi:MAG: hypothetical protein CMI02_10550, partial [Oceanospirillaceae bacterium]|nr:hypothetical protein [Oceanospirillaceae bacterium]
GPLLDPRGLILLYIHELAHTLAPVYDYAQTITIGQRRVHVEKDKDGAHGKKFQLAMRFLFEEANRLSIIEEPACKSYEQCEMRIRETHQDSSLLL